MYYTSMIFLLVFNLSVLEHLFHLDDIDWYNKLINGRPGNCFTKALMQNVKLRNHFLS